jgi:hypothetical protein
MLRYVPDRTIFSEFPVSPSYPQPRCDFQPRAYVVLTRNGSVSRRMRHD